MKISIGPGPRDERLETIGWEYNEQKARVHCTAYINQLTRQFGPPPEGMQFVTNEIERYFGTTVEVGLETSIDRDSEMRLGPAWRKFAHEVKTNAPTHWDNDACNELGGLVTAMRLARMWVHAAHFVPGFRDEQRKRIEARVRRDHMDEEFARLLGKLLLESPRLAAAVKG